MRCYLAQSRVSGDRRNASIHHDPACVLTPSVSGFAAYLPSVAITLGLNECQHVQGVSASAFIHQNQHSFLRETYGAMRKLASLPDARQVQAFLREADRQGWCSAKGELPAQTPPAFPGRGRPL